MNAEKLFKNLILLSFALVVLNFLYGIFFLSDTNLEDQPFYTIDYVFLIILVVYLINLYLLYKFKPIGRQLYVFLTVLSFVLILFFPPEYLSISSKTEYFLDLLAGMTSGAILVLLYYSEISEKFK
jgi:hypothetical protein